MWSQPPIDRVRYSGAPNFAEPISEGQPPRRLSRCCRAGDRTNTEDMRTVVLGFLGGVAFLLAMAGCGTYEALAPEAASVNATTTRPAGKCESLGNLTGKGGGASGGYVSNESLIEYAVNDLRNQAQRLNATHVVYSTPALGGASGTTTSAMVMGEALRCEEGGETTTVVAAATTAAPAPTPAPVSATAAAPATGGCEYDTQCKGDRVCVNRQCVDPAPTPDAAAPSATAPAGAAAPAAGAAKP